MTIRYVAGTSVRYVAGAFKQYIAGLLAVLILTFLVLPPTPNAYAEPILKPKKYHGPIPQRSFSLSVGFLGGPNNEDMMDYLSAIVAGGGNQQVKASTVVSDFSTSLGLDAAFTVKMHPQFAFRLSSGLAFLRSDIAGLTVLTAAEDSLRAAVMYERSLDVDLYSLDASAIYYFQDASVAEFQAYLGGGLGFIFPNTTFSEDIRDPSSGVSQKKTSNSKWSADPAVHAVGGFLYHVRTSFAIEAQARVQIAQSKFTLENFPDIQTRTNLTDLSFDVDYTGFFLKVGVAKFF